MKTINILFLIYDLERGGPELRLLDFVKHFPTDIEMHICVTSENLSLLPEFLQFTSNITVIPVVKGYLELNKAWKIYRYVRGNHISIINSFGLKELFLSVAIKALSGWKLKIIHHSVDLLHHYDPLQRRLLKILLKSTDAVLCNSEQSIKLIKGFSVSKDKIAVIKNGISTDNFRNDTDANQNLKKIYGFGNGEVILGTIANFRNVKNYPFLIKAFGILSRRHHYLRLFCVGGGYLLDEMKSLVRESLIEEQVIFTGYSNEVVKYLSVMDIFVLCSSMEGFPNVLLQAMSMELPIVSTDVGGCPEIIDNTRNGILYPSNNLGKFIEAVEMLLENKSYASRLGINARKTVVREFSLDRMIKDYSVFYRALLR